MRRREFIAGLGGAAVWPVVVGAQQQSERVRRIGVLLPYDENDRLQKARISAFTEALAHLGWTDGRNMRMDLRSFDDDINRVRALAQELVGLQPDIILAGGNNVPAVYGRSDYARDGGLLSYGVDQVDTFRRAATYVDPVLRGAKPSELPVQYSTKFELVINLKTAKALGLTIPQNLLAIADEVIE
jgi:ABC-type uncharacterized transport system substrate-binding protein